MRGTSHGLVLYLPDEMVLALAKTQVKYELGRSFAGLFAINEGFYKIESLSDEIYEYLKNRYSAKLLERPKNELSPVRRTVVPTLEQINAKTELEELEKQFGNALEQWSAMKDSSKQYYLKKAEKELKKYPDFKNARLLLDLKNNDSEVSQSSSLFSQDQR